MLLDECEQRERKPRTPVTMIVMLCLCPIVTISNMSGDVRRRACVKPSVGEPRSSLPVSAVASVKHIKHLVYRS